jgi:hypothetical protein
MSREKTFVESIEDSIWNNFCQTLAFEGCSLDAYATECGGGVSLLVDVIDDESDGPVDVPA